MATATVTSKGQVTIPVAVRRELGLGAGSRIEFVALADGGYEIVPAVRSIKALKGIVRAPDRPVSMEEMTAAIATGAQERSER